MRIKQVSIQGFKTFARRTDFVFDLGITAVVGPNGSGKSNIVDAVRWCLGEQSFSLLRSRKSSDVIFSGSDKKARLNLAEVTLTLDNSAGKIPVDYSEVEITRRAYRDGDNEYLLNGQRVRLQDVVELLAQTGLGKRTYSVIGQGLIDRALSMAPEERRSLFEEAAGISGYQLKRGSTVRRLEATEQNLVRVRDILAELGPRLSVLRRQAERAQEREQIVRDLQRLLYDWYGYRWQTMSQQLQQQQGWAEVQRAEVGARQAELDRVGAAIADLRQLQTERRLQLGKLHAQSSECHRRAEGVGRTLAVAQEGLRQLQARREDAERELVPLALQQAALDERLAELHRAEAERVVECRERLQAVDLLQGEVARLQQERNRLLAEQAELRRVLSQRQQQKAELASRLQQIEERWGEVVVEQGQQAQALQGAEQAVQSAEAALKEAEQSVLAVEQEGLLAQQRLGELEAGAAGVRQELQVAEQGRQGADRLLDRLQTRQDLLQRLNRDGAGYGNGVRAVLQAQSSGRLRGVIGTVASQLRVPAHLEKAIESALGGALQNLVMASWETAAQAIAFLKEQRGGRATFLPLDRLHVQPAIPAPRRAGILGNAVDLVEYAGRVEEAAQQLLNRIWVAEDLAAARAALDELRGGARPTVVTLEGEIVRPGGALSGGSEGGRQDDSLLARERDLRQLPAQIAQASESLHQWAASCASFALQIEEQRLAAVRQQQLLADLARRERQLRSQLEELRRQADRNRQSQRWRAEQLAQQEAELRTLADRRVGASVQVEAVTRAEQEGLVLLAALERQLAAAGADALLQELANRRAAAAEAQGQLRSQQALVESTRRAQQSVADQICNKQKQIAGLGAEVARLTDQAALTSQEETGLSQQLETLRQQIKPLAQEVEALEGQQASAETRERGLQQTLRQAEALLNQALLQLQRSEDLQQQLRAEIEGDLGLLEASTEVTGQPSLTWEAVVERLPAVERLPDSTEMELRERRARLARLGTVHQEAPREYSEAAERYEFLFTQAQDLEAASADLQKVIKELDNRMAIELRRTYEAVGKEFSRYFQQLFNGGTAYLELTDSEQISQSGVEIVARPPGKRPQSLALLSGGERALAACALIFAILQVSPTPFCVLDEVDAALDEANVDRFRTTVEALSRETQLIIVTHNRRTLEGANTIYGVTMGGDGVSRAISLRLEGDRMVHNDGSAEPSQEEILL
ncbi:MAG: chromosome segregation protein SMC [Chloroflexi bacterium]|nr:chromosome segregation protein SMC [Chloroflexota bacterium]